MRRQLRDGRVVLGGFVPSIEGELTAARTRTYSVHAHTPCLSCPCMQLAAHPLARACLLMPRLAVPGRVLAALSLHNFVKTYYAPLLFRPLSFLRGLRALFGERPASTRFASCGVDWAAAETTSPSRWLMLLALLLPARHARTGDQTMFCRASDFRRVGGFDARLSIMVSIWCCTHTF